MKIGGLYSYDVNRNVCREESYIHKISTIQANKPFVLLEKSSNENEFYKVLTLEGVIGWVYLGDHLRLTEIKQT